MFTPEETKFLLHMLERAEIGGNLEAIRRALELADSIKRKLQATLPKDEPKTDKKKAASK